MKTIDPKEVPVRELYHYLTGAVSPRPIAFASTLSADGTPNLAPYSYFNVFSANPPILVFSPNTRSRDNSTKDTLNNLHATKEVVINLVNYDIVRQMAITSIDYPDTVNEFEKAGLTMQASEKVKPARVKESPVQFECKVNDIIKLGDEGGAGNLAICEVVLLHVSEDVLDSNGKIDPHLLDACGRLGAANYVRVSGRGIFEVQQPSNEIGVGVDNLPQEVRYSEWLTGNDIGELASLTELPNEDEVSKYLAIDKKLQNLIGDKHAVHLYARDLLSLKHKSEALKVLLAHHNPTKA